MFLLMHNIAVHTALLRCIPVILHILPQVIPHVLPQVIPPIVRSQMNIIIHAVEPIEAELTEEVEIATIMVDATTVDAIKMKGAMEFGECWLKCPSQWVRVWVVMVRQIRVRTRLGV